MLSWGWEEEANQRGKLFASAVDCWNCVGALFCWSAVGVGVGIDMGVRWRRRGGHPWDDAKSLHWQRVGPSARDSEPAPMFLEMHKVRSRVVGYVGPGTVDDLL